MKLKAQLVTRTKDQAQNFVSSDMIGVTAVVTDKAKKKADVLDVDSVEIVALQWHRNSGVFQVQLEVGGYDANGVFHRDPNHQPALVSWSRDQFPTRWATYGLGDLATFHLDDIKQWLHDEGAVETAGRNIWNLPTLESETYDDTGKLISTFTKGKK